MKDKSSLGAYLVSELAKQAHATAKNNKFWSEDYVSEEYFKSLIVVRALAMIHTEVAEATESLRNDEGHERFLSELADIVIRTLDLAGAYEERYPEAKDFGTVLAQKMNKNALRPPKHNKKF